MNKLEELEKKYEELGKEIEKLKKKDSFTAGWYAYWDNNNNNTPNSIEYYIDFIRTKEHLNEKLSDWDNVVKIDKDTFDKLLKPKTIYDWNKIPKEFNWAVTNEDGSVHFCNCTFPPVSNNNGLWEYQYKKELEPVTIYWKKCLDKSIVLNPTDDWKESLEGRPE